LNAAIQAVAAKPRIRDMLREPRMLAVLLLGAVSGLPNQYSESILQAWFTDLGFTNTRIGLLMYVALPYLLKPLWAPVIDRFAVPWLGRRRGWLLENGVTEEALATVHAPVGLDIGANAPGEIAVAILAEVIAVRAGRTAAGSVGDREGPIHPGLPAGDAYCPGG